MQRIPRQLRRRAAPLDPRLHRVQVLPGQILRLQVLGLPPLPLGLKHLQTATATQSAFDGGRRSLAARGGR